MKRFHLLLSGLLWLVAGASAAEQPISVRWDLLANDDAQRQYSSRLTIYNTSSLPLTADWQLFFNQFSRTVTLPADCPVDIEQVSTTYYRMTPNARYRAIAAGDSLVVDLLMQGTFIDVCYRPAGFHIVTADKPGVPIAVETTYGPLDRPEQWVQRENFPTGERVYAFNEQVNGVADGITASDYDIFPTPKQVEVSNGFTQLPNLVTIRTQRRLGILPRLKGARRLLELELRSLGIYAVGGQSTTITLRINPKQDPNPEHYRLVVDNGKIVISGASEDGVRNGVKTLVQAIRHSRGHKLQNARVTDAPDLRVRGYMIDIARNFTDLHNLKRLFRLLAMYKVNRVQFHFTDDEGWRIDIPGLPELTRIAARRGHTLDERHFLAQIFDGNGNPDDRTQSGNGYLTRDEFVDLLRYARLYGITVVPEIETPGHARAAIVAMRNRGDTTYVLHDAANTSTYTSAQGYHDNVLNVASNGVYRFLDKVIGELALMYRDAGLRLTAVHLGGDEVAHQAWDHSPAIAALKQQQHLADTRDVSEYYMMRISALLAQRGITVEGWQEVATNHSDAYNNAMRGRISAVNAWSTIGKNNEVPYRIANDGYPVLLSNVGNFYMDMGYSWHPEERGLHWGGTVDEFAAWEALPWNIYAGNRYDYLGHPIDITTASAGKTPLQKRENILGVQAQLFAETIRNFDHVQYLTLPKVLGVLERGWNAQPAWADNLADTEAFNEARHQYNLKIGTRELPLLKDDGYHFRIPQAGVRISNGQLLVNGQYPGMALRYTFDGSEPNSQSPMWTAPVSIPKGVKIVKACAYYLGRRSVTTVVHL